MKLKDWLVKHKIKQKTMAQDLGLSMHILSHLINGRGFTSMRNLGRIYMYTQKEVSLESLLSLNEKDMHLAQEIGKTRLRERKNAKAIDEDICKMKSGTE